MKRNLKEHFLSPHKSVAQRIAKGKALRTKYPRQMHAEYKTNENRIDPISILEKQAATRLPELVPIRHARMLASPFAFLRGAAAIMAQDLAKCKTTGITVQACGDMHVANFGVFASAERSLIFGINDFDETINGPWEWDVKRLVTSVVSSGKFLEGSDKLCKQAVRDTVKSYREKMHEYALMGNLELWYSTIKENDILDALSPSAREGAEKIFSKARGANHMQVLGKLTDMVDDKYRLRVNAPFIVRETHTKSGMPIKEALGMFLDSYFESLGNDRKNLLENYRIVDVARKIVGVGSVGTRCWIIYFTGNHDNDPLFLQLKEAQPSVFEPYTEKSIYQNEGQRVTEGQKMIQGAPDIFLGYGEQEGFHFYVRQLRDMKGGVEFEPGKVKVKNLPQYGTLCGWALALAHAKSGDAAMLSGYVGNSDELDEAMTEFAFAYNEQNEKDYSSFQQAIKTGRLAVGKSK